MQRHCRAACRAPATPSAAAAPVVAEQDRLAALLAGGNLAYALLTFFGAGLLLSLTPCVLPMIPILSGIIVGQGEKVTRTRSFSLAFTYVQGMALTYAAAGAIFVLAFKQAPQAFFQQPWIIGLMVLLFVALAFAMFGAYTLQLPSALQTRLTDVSNQQKSGTLRRHIHHGRVVGAGGHRLRRARHHRGAVRDQPERPDRARCRCALCDRSRHGRAAADRRRFRRIAAAEGGPVDGYGEATVRRAVPRRRDLSAQPLLPDTLSMLLWSALAVIAGFWIFSLKARNGAPIAAPCAPSGCSS